MKSYISLVKQVFEKGAWKKNRTGEDALTISGASFHHSLKNGFPLLTTKRMAWKSIKVELEFFIKGLTDKRWLQERGCHIWDAWCNPERIDKGLSGKEKKARQEEERDLGPIYGKQWRDFNGADQLKKVIEDLKADPSNRRMVVSSWNPTDIPTMALPPCHILFHLTVIENALNLSWFQRSVDVAVGLPFNIASYALLLHLLTREAGLQEGMVHGFLSDVHIYRSHIPAIKNQLDRLPHPLPNIKTTNFKTIFDWQHQDTTLIDYTSYEKIHFKVMV